ncbi:hypothetical protein PanWU01x14_195060 [Parasponia andersonii]|uniref:Uncharacterized protein n=1 Tax=Parasponia andersonii TaxID=3476 RepID=A0A2P5C049_PARAD|nr:hypothetical protein PanWU01x14_195060 [Parasponia andersonii]
MLSKTTSPTTISKMEISCRLPPLMTSILMLSLIFDSLSNCVSCLKLLRAEPTMTSSTAMKMLPPSYQPSFPPCSLIPKPRDRAAHIKRIKMVVSFNASTTK